MNVILRLNRSFTLSSLFDVATDHTCVMPSGAVRPVA